MKTTTKLLMVIAMLLSLPMVSSAQTKKTQPSPATVESKHKAIIQVATNDTIAHKQLMKQLNNLLTTLPGIKVEVVCHGPGLEMLIAEKTSVSEAIHKFKEKGVVFNACAFSMSERKVEQSQLVPDAGTVPFAIAEIITRQEQGWSYVKSGY